ncbi:WhiB family transcriptional regulator [Streptomyces hoynatensis]|uniref:WhiB family transcriptional regulator n=1 Tax=Streptomyces hoynatensis TaxID=1141874 RepID=UPI0015768C4E|nr:WhiB family transcriptional regulator [Streptomyces hoynatensis]
MTSHDWERSAVCRTTDPELWFPPPGDNGIRAIRICRRCPVRRACLDAALAEEGTAGADRRHGIRGGLTPTARAQTQPRQAARDRASTPTN